MNKKIYGIISVVLSLAPLTSFLINTSNVDTIETIVLIYLLLSIAAIVLGFIGRKENKVVSIIGIVLGFIGVLILGLATIGFKVVKEAKDCTLLENGNYKCIAYDQEIEVPAFLLRDEQKK